MAQNPFGSATVVGWPGINATGSGNLVATTGGGDTVGYQFTDHGSGGFVVLSEGTGEILLQALSGSGGIGIEDDGTHGILITEGSSGTGDIILRQQGSGIININTSGSDIHFGIGSGAGHEVLFAIEGANFVISSLPTSNPHVVGALWSNSDVVTVSAG
jgi:hypothetical protein